MEKRPLAIYGYEVTTPKFRQKEYIKERFDFELIHYLLNKIIKEIPLEERAFITKDKMINLISFGPSDYNDLYEGVFITARYGKKQEIVDVMRQKAAGVKEKDHGVKNEVLFLIDQKTGLLLLEKDSEQVASAVMIRKFIARHKDLIINYKDEFNRFYAPYKIHMNSFLKINSLPKKSFFEEIRYFSQIKEAFYYLDIKEIDNNSNEASNLMYLHDVAEDNGIGGTTRVKVSFENKIRKGSISGIEKYFKKLFESQHFDGLGVRGTLDSGRQKSIELENIQRVFDVEIVFNENGIPSYKDLKKEMANIILKDNPIGYKINTDQFKGVMHNDLEENKEKEI